VYPEASTKFHPPPPPAPKKLQVKAQLKQLTRLTKISTNVSRKTSEP
jgi:hypothetical protein